MKIHTLLTTIASVLISTSAFAAGDLSRANPQEIHMEMGSGNGKMFFKPAHLEFETGKAYKLVITNTDTLKHEIESHEFIQRIFTRKVEVLGSDGKMLAEIKGAVSEVEVAAGGVVEWYFVPVQDGKNLAMDCAIAGHKEAGMFGTITIN
ncbi:MAG: putative cupredoxin-like copper-binding protein [Gammaproteobacteria bacterium]|jgi:uncharacterized cupredoxin-like copper-binding protein